ncbi:MAG TPA: hypothetical protein VKB56_13630, partial [Terriglobales bacterium]|nr:hypothetical protein [Terriglobales bacterium]
MRKLVLAILLACVAAAAQVRPAATGGDNGETLSETRLPVRRVVLYKNGVGYFEHSGRVRGTQDV